MVDIYLRVVWLVHLCHVTCGVIQSNVAIFAESQNDNTTLALAFLEFLEWFSVECPKTKTKVITLANHKEHTQYSEPIKARSNYR